jgi:histidine ammonia-lyase
MSHAAGVGAALPREIVRAMLLLRANTLALGHSGCRPVVVDRLLDFLRLGLHPVVPEQGSVGASGDLAPLAHLALPLIGRGQVELGGSVIPGLIALREAGLEPLELGPKEGLALLNGTQMMGAIGALVLADADRLTRTASVVAAMSVEAMLGTDVAFSAAYQLARPHPGQIEVAAELRHLLRDSGLQTAHHGTAHKVQDPYSLRCIPQVHGAVRDTLDHLRRVLDIELNSATDNPLVFPGGGVADPEAMATGGGRVISGGNFQGEPIAFALDFATIAIAELGSISERRTALLVDPRLNGGLPPFLAAASGIDSGMMIHQYTAAALVSENKVLAHPASVDSIPTSANQEDHVSMGSISARHARAVLANVERILAIELLVAAQALDLRLAASDGAAPGAGVAEALARVRARVRHLDGDREPGPDLAGATGLVRDGALADLA